MKIAFNLWTLKNKKYREGIGWLITHCLNVFLKEHKEVEFIFFTTRDFDVQEFAAPNVKIYRIFPNKRHVVLYISFLHYLLPFFLRRLKPDLLVSADGMSSLYTSTTQLPMIHDIHFFHYPLTAKLRNRWYYNRYFPKYAKLAERIVTLSEFSKMDIAKSYKVPASKIDIIYCGVNEYILHDHGKPQPFRFEYLLTGKPYFFFIGSLNPRKNVDRLIKAFDIFRSRGHDARLVIGGAKGWLTSAVDKAFAESNYKDDIVFTGRLADDEVKPLLQGALALCFVPYFEGFGIPPLEAMMCGTPVLSSNATSLPEVTGDAALYVDPFNVEEIANGLVKMFTDEAYRNNLIAKGNERWKLFSWERTAALLWESIEKTVAQAKRK
jgi:glycosyltransferase involved in cell wall biosynthesis